MLMHLPGLLQALSPALFQLPVCATATDAFEPASCRAVVVGVLEWQHRGFASFAKEERQDALFAQTLLARGVPADHLSLLLDEAATREQIEAKLIEAASAAEPESTLLFYYAGHGTRVGESGCFANYDMTGSEDGFRIDRIADIVEDHFEGRRVLLFADCCFSGLLGNDVQRVGAAGFEAACATSVVAESTSTGNWTFTQTLIEAFGGDPTLDRDGDGAVERGELDGAVRSAMAWRETQRSAADGVGIGPDFVLGPSVASADASRLRAAARQRQLALPFALGDHVWTDPDHERVGRVVGLTARDELLVRRYDYATHEDVELPVGAIAPIACEMLAVDTVVGVELGPDVVPARVVAVEAPFHRVAYPTWPEMPDDWKAASQMCAVPADFDVARACMVEWKSAWYPAVMLGEVGSEWRIHYIGYGSRWDEAVDSERIRFAAKPDHD